MKSIACIRASGLIERRSAGLSSAEALRLEEHLASCARCNGDAQLVDGLGELASAQPNTLPPLARERAIRAALAQAQAEPAASQDRRWLWPAAAAAGLAAAVAFGLVFRASAPQLPPARDEATALAPRPAESAPVRIDRVLAGQVEVDGTAQAAGNPLAALAVVRAHSDATLALGHATVRLHAGTELRWDRQQDSLRLDAGSLVADVDPSAGRRFTVETQAFSVLVLGTRFEVSLQAVKVERGHVRVTAPDGAILAESLGPGERLVVPPPRAETQITTDAERATASANPRPRRAKPAVRGEADPTLLLAEARAQLAARRVGEARRSLEAALGVAQARDQRAEAMTLRAECALVDGDLAGAVEAYLRVARSFERYPAGQNALFAAARLEAERGRSAAAVTLLERYLGRYPQGRFVKEARARLRDLGAVLDHQP